MEEGIALAQSWDVPFFESCAKMRVNVDEVFQQLLWEVGIDLFNRKVPLRKRQVNCSIL